jgi:hypothetical protein
MWEEGIGTTSSLIKFTLLMVFFCKKVFCNPQNNFFTPLSLHFVGSPNGNTLKKKAQKPKNKKY